MRVSEEKGIFCEGKGGGRVRGEREGVLFVYVRERERKRGVLRERKREIMEKEGRARESVNVCHSNLAHNHYIYLSRNNSFSTIIIMRTYDLTWRTAHSTLL